MLFGLCRLVRYGITRANLPRCSSKRSRISTAPSELSERSCMVVTKIRPSGDLAINRTRFHPSAAGALGKSAGSINENGGFPCKRPTCGVTPASGADWEEHTDGIAAAHKIKGAAALT